MKNSANLLLSILFMMSGIAYADGNCEELVHKVGNGVERIMMPNGESAEMLTVGNSIESLEMPNEGNDLFTDFVRPISEIGPEITVREFGSAEPVPFARRLLFSADNGVAHVAVVFEGDEPGDEAFGRTWVAGLDFDRDTRQVFYRGKLGTVTCGSFPGFTKNADSLITSPTSNEAGENLSFKTFRSTGLCRPAQINRFIKGPQGSKLDNKVSVHLGVTYLPTAHFNSENELPIETITRPFEKPTYPAHFALPPY